MSHHLVCGPIQRFFKTVNILEVCDITHRRHCCTLFKIFDKVHLMEPFFKRIPSAQFPGFDLQHIQALILASPQCQLDIALIPQHKLRLYACRLNYIALPVTLRLGLKGHQIELTQLGRRLQEQAFAQKGTCQNRARVAFLQGRIDSNGASDIGNEAGAARRIAQRVIHEIFVHRSLDRLRKAHFLRLHCFSHCYLPPDSQCQWNPCTSEFHRLCHLRKTLVPAAGSECRGTGTCVP